MRILPSWLREFVNVAADDRQLAEDLTSAGIAVESVQEEDGQTVYEMDLTTNRVDAMNHYGVAREASAIYDVELKPIEPNLLSPTLSPKPGERMGHPIVNRGLSTAAARSGPPEPALSEAEGLRMTNQNSSRGMTNGKDFPIVLEDPQGCARYTARIVRNVKIGRSPELIARRLELLGSRSINNVADATNYAINELGHPTHAFDLDLLEGGTIIVRRARADETLKTLDGVERKLTPDDLVIADAKKPVALAGVMGGFDSMITERTKNVLIESAWFDPATVRSTAKRLGMHTDASHRFERGADWAITPTACDRVAELILQSAGGESHGERIDAIARRVERPPIALRHSEVKRILGVDISSEEIERILGRLGFGLTSSRKEVHSNNRGPSTHAATAPDASAGGTVAAFARDDKPYQETASDFMVQAPSWRLDVEREIDLLEELARIHGYNRFPNTLPAFSGSVVALPDEEKNAKLRETMLALGYNEAISITFVSEQDAKTFGTPARVLAPRSENPHPSKGSLSGAPKLGGAPGATVEPLAIANPLSEEAGFLRTSLIPGLLNLLDYNLNRGTSDVRLFEAGELFEKVGDSRDERRNLALVATGNAVAGSVHANAQPMTFFHIKGAVEKLLRTFQHETLHFDRDAPGYFHPGRSARAVMDGDTVAYLGQLHPELATMRKFRQDVYLAEILLDRLYRHPLREPRYQPISRFPAVQRDFSFVFEDAVSFEHIEKSVAELGITELQSFAPAEIYRGEKVGAGKYSVLLRAEFQSKERTLRDEDVAQWSTQIIARLEALGGALRAQ